MTFLTVTRVIIRPDHDHPERTHPPARKPKGNDNAGKQTMLL